ncbi:MAG: hypothetical protein AAF840_15605, partial [Bacteroidota bacterium]
QLISPLGQVLQSGVWSHGGGQQQYRLNLAGQVDGVYLLQLNLSGGRPIGTKRVVKIAGN